MDILEKAEAYSRKLATHKQGGDFPYIGLGGRGVILAVMDEIRGLETRLAKVEQHNKTSGPQYDQE